MRKLVLFVFMALVLIPSLALGYTGTFKWTANTEPDMLGYRLWQAEVSGGQDPVNGTPIADVMHNSNCVDTDSDGVVDECTVTVANIADGTHFWVLTAYDLEDLESGPGNEISYTYYSGHTGVPPAPNESLEFRFDSDP